MLQLRPRASLAISRGPIPATKSVACRAAVLDWPEITIEAGLDVLQDFYVSPGSKPATSPTPLVAGSSAQTTSSKPVLLYRDTNGWCPYCQLVWMALLEKNIPFDTMLIDLRNKPEWYTQVATNNLTPAVKFGNEAMCESLDIMFALEERFPDSIPLLPKDAAKREAATEFVKNWGTEHGIKLFRPTLMRFTRPGPAADAAIAEAAGNLWPVLDALLEQHGGPFLFGDLSLADICAINGSMRVRNAVPNWQESSAQFPRVAAWLDAMSSRESWKKTCVDDGTYSLLLRKSNFAGANDMEPTGEVDMSHIDEESMKARREAAAKIAKNKNVIAEKLVMDSGVLRGPGSTMGPGYSNINGYMTPTRKGALLEAANSALQRLCTMLLTDQAGDVPSRESAAVQVAMLAYFANLASSPRDLSAAAVTQLRAACHKVIVGLYMP